MPFYTRDKVQVHLVYFFCKLVSFLFLNCSLVRVIPSIMSKRQFYKEEKEKKQECNLCVLAGTNAFAWLWLPASTFLFALSFRFLLTGTKYEMEGKMTVGI